MKACYKNLFVFLLTAQFAGLSPGFAAIYEYQYTPPPSVDSNGFAHYKIFVPDELDTIKGIYCYLSGWQGSSLHYIDSTYYQQYAANKGMAFMCFRQLGAYTNYELEISLWSGEAFIGALAEFATMSGHPEIEHAALLFDGWSAGGQFSYHFTKWKPERVIAFVTIKGGYHSIAPAGDAVHVPGYMFIGENDLPYRLTNLTGIFETHRPLSALWSLALQPDAGHERVEKDIIHAYFDAIVPLRLPDEVPLDTIPQLLDIDELTGWLGNRETFEIDSFPNFSGDVDLASWFPDEGVAEYWQNFVQGMPLTNVGSNIHADEDVVAFHNCFPNPVSQAAKITFELKEKTQVSIGIFNSQGKQIENLTTGIFYAGSHEISWQPKNIEKGIYFYKIKAGDYVGTKKIVIRN